MTTTKSGTPTKVPPQSAASTRTAAETAGDARPMLDLTDEGLAAEVTEVGPTLAPPSTGAGVAAAGETEAAAGTWISNVTINALWTINQPRNAWANVVGTGWRRIYAGSDGAFQALCTLASQARQTNRPCNVRVEADGMIHEIYLW